MKRISLAAFVLRTRIALAAAGPVAIVAFILCVGALAGLAWLVPARELAEQGRVLARQAALQGPPAPPAAAPPATDAYHLALFEAALGERREAGQAVKTLFALAAKQGLSLRQGEYKSAYDRNARLHTYQVSLPVKGSYGAIWQFALGALRALPYASLDEISFRRDAIGDPAVEARVRLTLYLAERGPGEAP